MGVTRLGSLRNCRPLPLGFFVYNRGMPLTMRSAFYPLLGERIWGWPGHLIDTLAVFASLFRARNLTRLGASTGNSRLNHLWPNVFSASNTTMVVLIALITAGATASVLTGLNVGIKRLSQFNMILAFGFSFSIMVVGPTLTIFQNFFAVFGAYFAKIRPLSTWTGRSDTSFCTAGRRSIGVVDRLGTLRRYIHRTCFKGTHSARIHNRRTAPADLLCLLWFSAFGGTALELNSSPMATPV